MSKYGDEILDIILNSTQHPTAEQIFMEMKKKILRLFRQPYIIT